VGEDGKGCIPQVRIGGHSKFASNGFRLQCFDGAKKSHDLCLTHQWPNGWSGYHHHIGIFKGSDLAGACAKMAHQKDTGFKNRPSAGQNANCAAYWDNWNHAIFVIGD